MNCKKLVSLFLSSLLFLESSFVFAGENGPKKEDVEADKTNSEYNIRELVLPSETTTLGKSAGSIFYSPAVKGKVLIPVHFWGAIGKTGLHFIPIETSLVNGLSMAGGPSGDAVLDKVRVTRKVGEKIDESYFDISKGGDATAFDYKLKPGDTVFIEKDDFYANRAYYTSLIGVIATVLSSILLYRQVQRRP